VYYYQNHYERAVPLYKRALEIREKALGPDHPDVAQTLRNLAYVYKAQGRYTLAEQLYKRSLVIREKALSPKPSEIAADQHADDPLARMWDVEHVTGSLYVMAMDISHGDQEDPECLSIYVGVDTTKKEAAGVIVSLSGKADRSCGLVMCFVESGKTMSVPDDAIRVLPLKEPMNGIYQIWFPEHVVPAKGGEKELNVVECLMKYQMVAFMYWIDGKQMRASVTLSGFQEQYPHVRDGVSKKGRAKAPSFDGFPAGRKGRLRLS
jgi:hypothetical protein